MICHKTSHKKFLVTSCGDCHHLEKDRAYTVEDLSGGHCKYLLHSIFPYVLTLKRGGYFRWVMEGDGVIAKCTSLHPSIGASLSQSSDREIHTTVFEAKGNCPAGYSQGQKLDLSTVPCLDLLAQILPLMLTEHQQDLAFTCQSCPKGKALKGMIIHE